MLQAATVAVLLVVGDAPLWAFSRSVVVLVTTEVEEPGWLRWGKASVLKQAASSSRSMFGGGSVGGDGRAARVGENGL